MSWERSSGERVNPAACISLVVGMFIGKYIVDLDMINTPSIN